MGKLFWVGPRESDICGLETLFSGSITLYGSDTGGNCSYCGACGTRINHNVDHPASSAFILERQLELIRQYPDCQFMSYNPNYTHGAPESVVSRNICLNPQELLEMLDNKQSFRDFAQKLAPMLKNQVRLGRDCTYVALQDSGLWTDSESYIIQETVSSGGQGTFFMDQENEADVLNFLEPEGKYLVSGFVSSNIPLNIHAVIYDEDILFFPGSVQVIVPGNQRLLYRGADFPTYQALPTNIKDCFLAAARPVCKAIQTTGYRGVLGVDGIWTKRGIFLLEVNDRFQGSTYLLNRALLEAGLPSVQACTMAAFQHETVSLELRKQVGAVSVPYSFFTQIHENGGAYGRFLLDQVGENNVPFEILLDGYRGDQDSEDCACQYAMVFHDNILSLCDGNRAVRLHPSLPAPSPSWQEKIRACSLTELKIGLANQGTVILPQAADYIHAHGGMREGTYFSLDLLVDGVYMNTPLSVKLVDCSPYSLSLRRDGNGLCLLYYGAELANVEYDICYPLPCSKTVGGVLMERISFLATDRLRLQNNPYCTFPRHGLGCRFCEVTGADQGFGIGDILETIDHWFSKHPRPFRHILIGGASNEPGRERETILAMCYRIRSYSQMPIYLMCLPPQERNDIQAYVEAGVTEFAFNMELYDRALALRYMPGKGRISRERYLNALRWAADCVGKTGAVRCSFIAGLEPMESLLEGVEAVCQLGAAPILSPFRPVPFTDMQNVIPPSNEWLLELTQKAENICQRYGLTLGPSCPACRNNTLTIVESGEALDFRRAAYPEF